MKKKREWWFPLTRPKQLIMFTNVKAKIDGYKASLPLAQAKIDRIILICDIFIAVYNYVEQTRATMKNLTDWQDLIFTAEGGTQGDAAPAVPAFQTLTMPLGSFVGIFEEFKELVEDIKTADNYTEGIGEDLMIVASEPDDLVVDDIVCGITPQALPNSYKIRISGSLQGMNAVQAQYQPKGSNALQNFFLTKLPAEITVVPAEAGQPESGFVRGVLIKDNAPIGQWSPDFPVTVS